jgi:hypothetical protein
MWRSSPSIWLFHLVTTTLIVGYSRNLVQNYMLPSGVRPATIMSAACECFPTYLTYAPPSEQRKTICDLVHFAITVKYWYTILKSIPNGVIGIFHWHNSSGRTMALGSTQALTEMSTRGISWGWRWPVHKADKLTTFMYRLSWSLGASTPWNPQGLSRSVMGLLYLYTIFQLY